METLKRRLFWWTILVLTIGAAVFLCFCFVPLEDYIESDAQCMKLSHEIHHVNEDHKNCPGCHPFLWRFNIRTSDLKEDWEQADPEKKK
ncbi:MAG: hypothetical protein MJZ35_03065 [Bacteroidaceae bacterium]|nr:hypothetical protein [Bacteroidaceae bacterium]